MAHQLIRHAPPKQELGQEPFCSLRLPYPATRLSPFLLETRGFPNPSRNGGGFGLTANPIHTLELTLPTLRRLDDSYHPAHSRFSSAFGLCNSLFLR
jgi:hypothetical protein